MILKQKMGMPILALILILIGQPIDAAQSDSILKVGISPFSPFVMLSGEKPIGLSIDIWQALSRELDIKYEYVECKGVADKLKRLQEGRIDIAIGGITITEAREMIFDFTHPVFHTGLDILIPSAAETTIVGLFSSLFSGNKLVFLAGLLLIIIIAGHAIWFVERSSEKRTTMFNHDYFPGVFQGMYWALITASTIGYGDKVPKRWIGRILAGMIIIIVLPLFGYFIAQLSSDLTVQSLKANINGPEDLRGRRVAVVAGTTSYDYTTKLHAYLTAYEKVEDAFDPLLQGQVDAVVYDAPNLLYYANGEGKGKVTVVGKIFEPQDYGLALPQGSPLREEINRTILKLIGSDEMERITSKWLGYQSSS
ncbi:MAG: transporter substrate-binding domain-containing protein [Deltaproteobacteria bacterium]|jgi:ABC-type amino acid transport substrate-binding protein|nr:transporter substrate-binding domain-containing protein [Deltaproteobacteria bacterium]